MDPIKDMKMKVIEEFMRFMKAANLGLRYDYVRIMDKISFIEYSEEIKNADFVYQHLMNK